MRGISRLLIIIVSSIFFLYQGCKSEDEKEQQLPAHGMSDMAGDVAYTIPDEWKVEKPSNAMRKAQFRIPGVEDFGDAEMAVFVFPGGGGAVQANINRWIGQFKQPDGSESMEKVEVKKIESGEFPVTIVYVTGTYQSGSMGGPVSELTDHAMIAAIVETSTDPWFFKTTGPATTINHWRQSFEKFAGTMRHK